MFLRVCVATGKEVRVEILRGARSQNSVPRVEFSMVSGNPHPAHRSPRDMYGKCPIPKSVTVSFLEGEPCLSSSASPVEQPTLPRSVQQASSASFALRCATGEVAFTYHNGFGLLAPTAAASCSCFFLCPLSGVSEKNLPQARYCEFTKQKRPRE